MEHDTGESEIRTIVRFEAAHRQLGDKSQCGYLHGHNWVVEVKVTGIPNAIGYVVDFKDLKNVIKEDYDHKVILKMGDPLIDILETAGQRVSIVPKNPTCENLSKIIAHALFATIGGSESQVSKVDVVVWENHESLSRYSLEVPK